MHPLQNHRSAKVSSWSTATERDIGLALKGVHSVETASFVGRGDYFLASSVSGTRKFIKVILHDGYDHGAMRRVQGERLAAEITLPEMLLIRPLVSERVVESPGYPGDFYVVSEYLDNTFSLDSVKEDLSEVELNSLGEYIAKIEQVDFSDRAESRRATDIVAGLEYLSKAKIGDLGLPKTRAANQVLEILGNEAHHIEGLAGEVYSKSSNRSFSHGDLKFSQFIKRTETSELFLCDWEECGKSLFANDLCYLASDLFYSTIRKAVDRELLGSSSHARAREVFDLAIQYAGDKVKAILKGYLKVHGLKFSEDEKRVINIRIGLAGLFRIYSASGKVNEIQPRELALASIGMEMAIGAMPELFFEPVDSGVV